MKAAQTYLKEQALQASDPHCPYSFAIQQQELPVCYRQRSERAAASWQWLAIASIPKPISRPEAVSNWVCLTCDLHVSPSCLFHVCIWPRLWRQTSWSDYSAVHAHSRPDWNRWKNIRSPRHKAGEAVIWEAVVSPTPLSGCGKIKGNEQQLAVLAWKPGFWYWWWIMRLWTQSSGEGQS